MIHIKEPPSDIGQCAKPGCKASAPRDNWCYGCKAFICDAHRDIVGREHDASEHWRAETFKTCSCGIVYATLADFRKLPLHAVGVTLDGGVDETLEYRNCACKSTLAILCRREARYAGDMRVGDVGWLCRDGRGSPIYGAKMAFQIGTQGGMKLGQFSPGEPCAIVIPIDPQPESDEVLGG